MFSSQFFAIVDVSSLVVVDVHSLRVTLSCGEKRDFLPCLYVAHQVCCAIFSYLHQSVMSHNEFRMVMGPSDSSRSALSLNFEEVGLTQTNFFFCLLKGQMLVKNF